MSCGVPLATSRPASKRCATSHRLRTATRSWLTSRIARPSRSDLLDLVEAPPLELLVADREHLVDDEDLRLEMGGDGKAEPHLHAAREVLHRRVDEPSDSGEVDDVVELAAHLRAAHAEHGAREEHVLAAGQVDVEARAHLEQRADPATDLGTTF